jgi:hypothetical protein
MSVDFSYILRNHRAFVYRTSIKVARRAAILERRVGEGGIKVIFEPDQSLQRKPSPVDYEMGKTNYQ